MQRRGLWVLGWGVLSLTGCLVLGRIALERQSEGFDTDFRIAHRLLSQRVVQHDAVLATLTLLGGAPEPAALEQRLSSVYPQIVSVQRRQGLAAWGDVRLNALEAESRRLKRAVLADVDLAQGRYRMMMGAEPASFALQIDMRSMVPWAEWPMDPVNSPVQLNLEYAGQAWPLQPGHMAETDFGGWSLEAHKVLAAESQPLMVVARRQIGWSELPWGWMLLWSATVAALLWAASALLRQRRDSFRAAELLRLGKVARLNTLGELAAGIAHELNQPLTAVLANTQAAGRLLDDDPTEWGAARAAMQQAAEQARRASAVVGRLRRALERPDGAGPLQPVSLQALTARVLYLLEPEFQRRHVVPRMQLPGAVFEVMADPVALEQIIHNLLMNALQALERVPAGQRSLTLTLSTTPQLGCLTLADSGPGIAEDVLPRIFEPFFTTREEGLGLGLSLCETLATGMGGSITAANRAQGGAEFCLGLPLAIPPETVA